MTQWMANVRFQAAARTFSLPPSCCATNNLASSFASTTWPVGLMDKASASGAGDSRFESWAGHTYVRLKDMMWLSKLTRMFTLHIGESLLIASSRDDSVASGRHCQHMNTVKFSHLINRRNNLNI